MSLYVFISRKPEPTSDEGPEISESEWHALAAAQPDFRAPTSAELEASSPVGASEANDVIWQRPDGGIAWFSWFAGQVEVKNADQPIIVRMLRLANELSARVVSETGEVFDATGGHTGFEQWSEFYVPPKKPSLLARLLGKRLSGWADR